MDVPLSYPSAENLTNLLYHSAVSPYRGMRPSNRYGGEERRPAKGMEGYTFSFAAKYRREIERFVMARLGGPPRFVIEVGSYLGAGATMTWAPLARRGGGLLLCVDTWHCLQLASGLSF